MRTAPLLALAALLVGCGGAGGDTSFIEGTTGAVNVTFTPGDGYNGASTAATPLTSYTSLDGSAASKVITITATNSDRGVEASLVASSAKAGATVDLSNSANGSAIIYSDSVGKWSSTSGTITVTARTTASVQITLANVVLTNLSGTNAAGTVTLNGTMTFNAS